MPKIDFIVDETLLALIDGFAKTHNINRSEAIRTIIVHGGFILAVIDSEDMFNQQLKQWNTDFSKQHQNIQHLKLENNIVARDNYKCRRCHNSHALITYHINRNPLDNNPENMITLCENCVNEAQKYISPNRVKQDFIEWFLSLNRKF
jgi:DNA-directed RNA polymerase subunit M/transcription elongation factor TFIIS